MPLIAGSNGDEKSFGYVFGPALDANAYATKVRTQFDAVVPASGDTTLSLYPADESSGDMLQLDATIASMTGCYRIAQMKFLSTLPIRGF